MNEQIGPYCYTQNSVRLTSDTVTLARHIRLCRGDRVCDLGCGAGALLLLLLAREPSLCLQGVELLECVCADARRNMAQNGLEIPVACADWSAFARENRERFDAVVSNPPYFDCGRGSASPEPIRACARTGDSGRLASLCGAAHALLVYGGRFTLCYPAAGLVDLFTCLRASGMEPKRLALHGKLACVEAKKGGKPGLEVIS